MRLFAGTSQQFLEDTVQNQIAEKLRLAFFGYFRYYPSHSELNSWRNSLRAVSMVFEHANLIDQGIMLEYQLPMTSKRLDCLICGRDANARDNAVIIELKQWDRCEDAPGKNEVITWVGAEGSFCILPFRLGNINGIWRILILRFTRSPILSY